MGKCGFLAGRGQGKPVSLGVILALVAGMVDLDHDGSAFCMDCVSDLLELGNRLIGGHETLTGVAAATYADRAAGNNRHALGKDQADAALRTLSIECAFARGALAVLVAIREAHGLVHDPVFDLEGADFDRLEKIVEHRWLYLLIPIDQ